MIAFEPVTPPGIPILLEAIEFDEEDEEDDNDIDKDEEDYAN